MVSAYAGTVDYEDETQEEARQEIERSFDGAYGAFLLEASLGIEQGEGFLSAVLVTLFEERPLFAFCMTRRPAKRRGLCRLLMLESLASLNKSGFPVAHLYVTSNNEPAVCLYRQLGFKDVENEGDARQL